MVADHKFVFQSKKACQTTVDLAHAAKMSDNVQVDWKNFFHLDPVELQKYNFNYLSTSAAHSELFNVMIYSLALKLDIPYILCPESTILDLKKNDLFPKNKKNKSILFANAWIAPEADEDTSSPQLEAPSPPLEERNVFRVEVSVHTDEKKKAVRKFL